MSVETFRNRYFPQDGDNNDVKTEKIQRKVIIVVAALFDEGVDVPACNTLVFGRKVKSINTYLQQLGRGVRRDPANPNKRLLICDLVCNIFRYWTVRMIIGPVKEKAKK